MTTRRRGRGFSMADLLVALGLFSTTVLAVMGLLPKGADAAAHGTRVASAALLAERALETARSTNYEALANTTESVSLAETSEGVAARTEYTVQTFVTEERSGLKKVRAAVSWVAGRPTQVEIETLVARTTL